MLDQRTVLNDEAAEHAAQLPLPNAKDQKTRIAAAAARINKFPPPSRTFAQRT
jgi:hypothetical protein